MDDLAISLQEIVEEITRLDSRVVELAVERVKNRKLSEALQAATEEQPDKAETPQPDEG
jgi:hypothetical protein